MTDRRDHERLPRPLPPLRWEWCGTPELEPSVLGTGPDPFVAVPGGWLRFSRLERWVALQRFQGQPSDLRFGPDPDS